MHVEAGTLLFAGAVTTITVGTAMFAVVRYVVGKERERMEAVMNGDRDLAGATYESKTDASKHRHEIRADFAAVNADLIARLEDLRDASVKATLAIDALKDKLADFGGQGRA